MHQLDEFATVLTLKTCCRCGGEFRTIGGRVCPTCRKPRRRCTERRANRSLTLREQQIATLVCKAKINKEIAGELCLTEGTVKEYLTRIFRKLGCKNRTDLAIWTVRNFVSGEWKAPDTRAQSRVEQNSPGLEQLMTV